VIERELGSGLREVVHQRVRLGILAILNRQGPCTFSQLRDTLGQSDGGMSRHLGVLEEHGYVATEKVFENRRPRTWIRMTTAGTEAFREEQELLGKLLAEASHEASGAETDSDGEGRTAAMTIVFAALLAGDDTGEDTGNDTSPGGTGHSTLIPASPVVVAGRRANPIGSGPISAQYEFPAYYTGFGHDEHRAQRLMMMSHGLRGGWITTWNVVRDEQDVRERDGDVTAHAMVVELAGATDCEAILAVMGPPTVSLPAVPGARGYLLPGAGDGAPATAVAWFSTGPYLASIVVLAAADLAVPALKRLTTEVYDPLSDNRI
jgi:DNA-binding MarR family transcriptional regulator